MQRGAKMTLSCSSLPGKGPNGDQSGARREFNCGQGSWALDKALSLIYTCIGCIGLHFEEGNDGTKPLWSITGMEWTMNLPTFAWQALDLDSLWVGEKALSLKVIFSSPSPSFYALLKGKDSSSSWWLQALRHLLLNASSHLEKNFRARLGLDRSKTDWKAELSSLNWNRWWWVGWFVFSRSSTSLHGACKRVTTRVLGQIFRGRGLLWQVYSTGPRLTFYSWPRGMFLRTEMFPEAPPWSSWTWGSLRVLPECSFSSGPNRSGWHHGHTWLLEDQKRHVP